MAWAIGWSRMAGDSTVRPLRRRLATVLVALTLGTSVGSATVAAASYLWLERTVLEDVLNRELDFNLENAVRPNASAGPVRLFRPKLDAQNPPARWSSLAPGSYVDEQVGDSYFHVLVREIAPGDRAWLIYDVADIESRERRAFILLLIGVSIATLLSWFVARSASSQVLRPLESLVSRIGNLRAGHYGRLPAAANDGELSAIVAAVNRLLSEIETLVDRERAFAGAAAHELRTPLTSIQLAADLLETDPAVPGPPLQRIHRAVKTASQDIDALLALSKTREVPDRETVQLQAWLRSLRETFEPLAQEHGTQMHWRCPEIFMDVPLALLRIIVSNVLRNSLRATAGGDVSVEVSVEQVVITDNGRGISAELLDHVFEPGTRGYDGGSGIGLYIAKTLAERCGWSLKITSSEGKGTQAVLKLQ
jgi:signal transduction histidine kinase